MNPSESAPPPLLDDRGMGPSVAPAVVTWFKVYAGLMAALYLLVAGFGVGCLVVDPAALDTNFKTDDAAGLEIAGWIYLALGAVFTIPFAVGVFMGNAPWCWIYGMVLICISLTSGCCMIAGIPLLIFWLKPETKAYYGRFR